MERSLYRCHDCNAHVHVPIKVDTWPPQIDEAGFTDAMVRHVSWNPDVHPTFVTSVD